MTSNRVPLFPHTRTILLLTALCTLSGALPCAAQQKWSFSCLPNHAAPTVLLTPASTFGKNGLTYGFDLGTAPESSAGSACSSTHPFYFSVAVPEGTYRVHIGFAGPQPSVDTVRAESRRLVVDRQPRPVGVDLQTSFNVHVRTPVIAAAASTESTPARTVRLKPREIGALDWDTKLTLEFNGSHPSVRFLSIERVQVPVIYLAGDSTVVDQDKEPWAAWGQMLPAFFSDGIAIANEAESGETIRSFISEGRWAKILSTLQPGDFVMVQFAHNDQKPGSGQVLLPDYKDLLRATIADTRARGATPILVTSMHRRVFRPDGSIQPTLGDYPQAMRDLAAEQHVALIDLNALSKTLFEALGEQGTLRAFVHYPANTFPDQPLELKDDTHFNSYGAYELARAIVHSIRDQQLPLAHFLEPRLSTFDPAHPDPVDTWSLPPSPSASAATPYGR